MGDSTKMIPNWKSYQTVLNNNSNDSIPESSPALYSVELWDNYTSEYITNIYGLGIDTKYNLFPENLSSQLDCPRHLINCF